MSTKPLIRYFVVEVITDSQKYETNVTIKSGEESTELLRIVLRGVWFTCDLNVDEVIHVFEAKPDKQTNQLVVDNESGFVVRSPDVLISSTTLMSANYCMRKAWLSVRFSGWTETNRSMLIGTVVHQLFQDSCVRRVRGVKQITELFESLLDQFIHNFYSIGITRSEILREVSLYIPSIAVWIDKYLLEMSAINDTESDSICNGSQSQPKLRVLKVHDIEDIVWSPKWGLKGVVDLTVEVAITEGSIQTRHTMPLELKTGKSSFSNEHIGQVGLYSVMMEDMTHSNEGLLLYLKDRPEMRRIVTKRHVKRDLIQLRNQLVKHLKNIESGPQPLNSYRVCSKCDHLLDCGLTLHTMEPQNSSQSRVMSEELIPQVISHLSEIELNFFKKWISLLNLEVMANKERDIDSKVGFWTESSTDRESKGLGFGKLILKQRSDNSVIFVRSDKFLSDFNLLDSVIRRWERVAISVDNHFKGHELNPNKRTLLSMGFIKSIDNKEIEIVLDKSDKTFPIRGLFRIDHLSSTGIISHNYTNLLRLMDSSDSQSHQLRRLIINKEPVVSSNKLKRQIVTKGKHILKFLNRNQQTAILKALSTDSYILLRGMPGAGKTQTIVSMIRLLVALEQTVLITSYTHAAVDNILLKLKDEKIDFLRIGAEKRVDPELHSYTVSAQTSDFKTVEELETYYSTIGVVASTCLGVSSHPIFSRRTFDYCIVDEASQVLLPTCLGPLFHCHRFMLVGDPKQLPPVVQSREAKQLGLDRSLFVLLESDSNTTDLTIQYRMNSEIMRLSNELTYKGVLKCSSYEVCTQTLNSSKCLPHLMSNEWLLEVMSSELSKSVIFLNTDGMPAPEVRDQNGKAFNETEVKLVSMIVTNFLTNFEISAQQIGVITPYQRQVRCLRDTIHIDGLEMNTVDQFQGRDKEIVIYSCVRSNGNENGFTYEILNDERRLNVGLTRAKRKLILIGSQSTLVHFKPFSSLFAILRGDQILTITSNGF